MVDGLPAVVAEVADRLADASGVLAVVLGGSRAVGAARVDSDWDLGIYYRSRQAAFTPASIRALNYRGTVSELGEWGPLVNGGAWFHVEGTDIDVLFRDLDTIDEYAAQAEQGLFDVLVQPGTIVGSPTYLPVGELACCRVLHGQLRQPEHYPPALAVSAEKIWRGKASVNLMFARGYAGLSDAVGTLGMLTQAVYCEAHARLASQKQWALNEKRMIPDAGLDGVQQRLLPTAGTANELAEVVHRVEQELGIGSANKSS